VREAKQAAFELRKREMIIARDLQYREAKLQRMREIRDRIEIEQKLREQELSQMERIEVTLGYRLHVIISK